MKRAIMIGLLLILVATAGITLLVPVTAAQQFKTVRPDGRGGNWEFMLPIIYTDSAAFTTQGGASLDINDDWSMGLGFGHNINDNVNISGLISWTYRSYEATVVRDSGATAKYSNSMETTTLSLNGTYYILPENITPFVSGGIGWTFVDSNIQDGPVSGTCWWDPWWGYVCSSYVPTKTEDDISYHAGIGVRFDVGSEVALQASYNKMWIDFERAGGGMPDFDLFKMEFIFRM
jgi:opacity protein-like surface antigen